MIHDMCYSGEGISNRIPVLIPFFPSSEDSFTFDKAMNFYRSKEKHNKGEKKKLYDEWFSMLKVNSLLLLIL
jgi:hypothetical protein